MAPWLQAAQGHTPTLHLDQPLKNITFVESLLWDWLVVAVTNPYAPRLNFLNAFKYCIRGKLTAI
jgi:hypothetical protein